MRNSKQKSIGKFQDSAKIILKKKQMSNIKGGNDGSNNTNTIGIIDIIDG